MNTQQSNQQNSWHPQCISNNPVIKRQRLNDAVVKSAPELVEMMSNSTYEIVGSFVKDDVAYVTFTLGVTVKGQAVTSQVVQTLKMHDGRWLLMLPSTAEGTIAGIEARFH